MDEPNDIKTNEQLQQRIAEAKKKAFEKESQRLDTEITKRANELVNNLIAKSENELQQKLQQAKLDRQHEEASLKKMEEEYITKIDEIIKKNIEDRRAKEEALRIKLSEERKRQEEIARQKAEEEERLRREEAERIRAEEKQRRIEEEKHLEEIARKRLEEESIKQEEEKQERIRTFIANARSFYESGDLEYALVEIAKALVNDPTNSEALELDSLIKKAKESVLPEEPMKVEEIPRPKTKEKQIVSPPVIPKKKKIPLPTAIVIITALIIITTVVVIQITRQIFKFPKTLAVINLTSNSNNLEENIIGSSIAEEISEKFTSISPKAVMNYSSVYNITKHTSLPEREIFRLGFSYILTGKINRDGDLYTFDLKIIDSVNNILWSTQIIKQPSGFADIPGEITKRLIKLFDIPIPEGETNLKISRTSTKPDAYFFYLRGLELLHRRTPESLSNAYELFLQSIQEDPKFAEGLASAADVLAIKLERGLSRGDSVFIKAKHLADASITANPQITRGYIALSKILAYEKNYTLALRYLDSAATLSPYNSNIDFERGKILLKIGKYNDALDAFHHSFKLNPRDIELLQTYANAYQLIGLPKQAMQYHELATKYAQDSLGYLSATVSDAILVDPELRLTQNQRILNACKQRITYFPDDYITLYNYGRLKQLMGHIDADDILSYLEKVLQDKVNKNPKDANALSFLALTLTRLGRFNEASALAEKFINIDPMNADFKYRVARIYSIQMYSQRTKEFDDQKKEEAVRYLRQAIALNYRIDELVNADFYNMFQRPEYATIIRDQIR